MPVTAAASGRSKFRSFTSLAGDDSLREQRPGIVQRAEQALVHILHKVLADVSASEQKSQ
jgi:hypothetical protein